jgi:hypothetical protein
MIPHLLIHFALPVPPLNQVRGRLYFTMNPNVGWIIARQGIALSDMLYLITDFPEVSIP